MPRITSSKEKDEPRENGEAIHGIRFLNSEEEVKAERQTSDKKQKNKSTLMDNFNSIRGAM